MSNFEKEEKTSYFDLDNDQLPDHADYTLYRLCKEIEAGSDQEKGHTIEDLLKKFHNNKGTGIIDHLKNDLNFDVYDYKNNMFQVLQFLKLIYRYEKEKSDGEKTFQITKVLLRPRVENIKSPYYRVSTLYGESVDSLLEELENVIGEEAKKRKEILVQRNQRWNNALISIMKLSFEVEPLKKENFDIAKNELMIVRDFLQKQILDKLERPEKHLPKDNIFMGFYTLLIEHMMICEEEDRIVSYEAIEKYHASDTEYVKTFVKWENYIAANELQEAILDKLIEDQVCEVGVGNDNSDMADIRYLIFGSKAALDKNDISGLRLARKYLPVLRKWLKEQKPSDIPETSLQVSWFVAIVQEIIYCNTNHIKVKNDAYGVKVKEKTLTSTLKKPDRADAKHIQEWMIRIENRFNADIGGGELQGIVREIETVFQQIRRWALQHHDLEDFLFVDHALVHTVERMIVPRFVAMHNLDLLGEKLAETGLIQQTYYYETVGLCNLGREMELDKSLMDKIVWLITDDMKNFDTSTYVSRSYKETIEVQGNLYNGVFDESVTYLFMYSLNRNGIVAITYFRPMEEDEVIYQYKSYGLGKLGITGKE